MYNWFFSITITFAGEKEWIDRGLAVRSIICSVIKTSIQIPAPTLGNS